MRKYFDETPAENLLDFSRKNRQQFAGCTNNDGTEDVGKTNVLLQSKPKDEQVTNQDAPGSESVF